MSAFSNSSGNPSIGSGHLENSIFFWIMRKISPQVSWINIHNFVSGFYLKPRRRESFYGYRHHFSSFFGESTDEFSKSLGFICKNTLFEWNPAIRFILLHNNTPTRNKESLLADAPIPHSAISACVMT